jgi:hypothetical protein
MRSVLLVVLALILVGCHTQQRSIVGTWSTRADVGGGTMIFRDDKTFRAVRETPLATMFLDGTYLYDGEGLRLHVVKWSLSRGPKLTAAEEQEMNAAFRADSVSVVRWTDDRHVRITGPNGELTTAELVSK